jgi:hypothetical protein
MANDVANGRGALRTGGDVRRRERVFDECLKVIGRDRRRTEIAKRGKQMLVLHQGRDQGRIHRIGENLL